jgi:hypothetical protein
MTRSTTFLTPNNYGNVQLAICPFCYAKNPGLHLIHLTDIELSLPQARLLGDQVAEGACQWALYSCTSCLLCISVCIAQAWGATGRLRTVLAFPTIVSSHSRLKDTPSSARDYLLEAERIRRDSPRSSILATATAIDHMLKHRGYKTGSLYERINAAVAAQEFPKSIGDWAHEVRLDANDIRHADEHTDPSYYSAQRADLLWRLAATISDVWFGIPAEIARGRAATKQPQ